MPRHARGVRVVVTLTAALGMAALAACSSSGGAGNSSSVPPAAAAASVPGSTSGSGSSSDLNSELPSDLRSKGSIDVAAVSDYPPISFSDSGSTSIKGVAVDVLNAAAKVLGTKFNLLNTSFDSLVPALKSGRAEIGSGGATDTTTNEQAALMVDYMKAGAQLIVPKGSTKGITDLSNACGDTVAVLAGSATYSGIIEKASSQCTSSGKSKINISTFQTADEALLALKAGRADAEFDSNVLQAYRIQQGADVQVVGKTYDEIPIAFQVLPQNKQLANALKDAIQKLIDDGTYKKILADWKMDSGALDKAGVNLASS